MICFRDAAFVGLPGNFRFQSLPAALVILNIFSGHVLMAAAVPLLITWPICTNKVGWLSLNNVDVDVGTQNGEHKQTMDIDRRVLTISKLIINIQAIKVCWMN